MTPRGYQGLNVEGHDRHVVLWMERTAGKHGIPEEQARSVVDSATQYEERRGKPGQPAVMWLVHGRAQLPDGTKSEILEVGIVPEWPEGVDEGSSDPIRYRIVHAMNARPGVARDRILMKEQGQLKGWRR